MGSARARAPQSLTARPGARDPVSQGWLFPGPPSGRVGAVSAPCPHVVPVHVCALILSSHEDPSHRGLGGPP